jgi:hypothetical protein
MLEADLGHPKVAAAAFESVARSPEATPQQRWESLVRLGVARRDAGDADGSTAAVEAAFRGHGKDPEALHFLLLALGQALPDKERWEQVYRQVTLDVDRRVPERPAPRVYWPGSAVGLCPCSGTPISLHFQEGDLQDVFRLADVSGRTWSQPGSTASATARTGFRGTRCSADAGPQRIRRPAEERAWIGLGRRGRGEVHGGPLSFEYAVRTSP